MGMSIHEACRRGDLDAVRVLVASDPSVVDADDQHRWRPVFHAAIARHAGVVRFLFQSGADLSAHEGYVLHYAGEVRSNKDIVALLITHGALDAYVRPASDLDRQFFAAVFLADEFRVRALMHLHPGVANRPDGRGDRPLHHAARHGDTAIVRALVSGGADVNLRSGRGQTVLYCAGGHGHADTVRLLLQRGANPAARLDDEGQTLRGWLRQFPDDPGLVEVGRVLDERAPQQRAARQAR